MDQRCYSRELVSLHFYLEPNDQQPIRVSEQGDQENQTAFHEHENSMEENSTPNKEGKKQVTNSVQ